MKKSGGFRDREEQRGLNRIIRVMGSLQRRKQGEKPETSVFKQVTETEKLWQKV